MNINLSEQEIEDLKQVLYTKIKELDADKSKVNNLRKINWADRLDALYKRISDL